MALGIAITLACLTAAQVAAPGSSAITHVTLIDGTGAPPARDVTVLLEGDEIRRIGPADEIRVPTGAAVIDGSGRFLLPGFWDMHVHVSHSLGGPQALPAFLAHGVIGVRDVGSSDSIAVWARETASGTHRGPRILLAGPQVGVWADYQAPAPPVEVVRSVADAARVIERRRGWADYVKLQDGFTPRDRWLAIARAARENGFLLAGHIPVNVPLTEAIDAGLRSIEHTFGLPLALACADVSLRARVMSSEPPWWNDLIAADAEALGCLDDERFQQVASHMVQSQAALDPTLNEVRTMAMGRTHQWDSDPRLALVPTWVRERWRQTMEHDMDSAYVAHLRALWGAVPGLVKRLHDSGVLIVAGSGAGTYFTFPGSGLHEELSLLVHAGLSPMEAIQAATRNPMVLMGRADSLGTIKPGKKADLVLLDADPLADIANTRRIVGVWLGGQHYAREQLDAMLEAVAATQARRTRRE